MATTTATQVLHEWPWLWAACSRGARRTAPRWAPFEVYEQPHVKEQIESSLQGAHLPWTPALVPSGKGSDVLPCHLKREEVCEGVFETETCGFVWSFSTDGLVGGRRLVSTGPDCWSRWRRAGGRRGCFPEASITNVHPLFFFFLRALCRSSPKDEEHLFAYSFAFCVHCLILFRTGS